MKKCFCGHKVGDHDKFGGCKHKDSCGCTRLRDPILGGMTLRVAAEQADMSVSMLSRVLAGRRSLSPRAFSKLVWALRLNANDLHGLLAERVARA